jgi:hypothetical protein
MSQRTIADTELDEIATDVRTRFGEEFPPAPVPGSPENDEERLMREEKTEAAVYDALRTVNRERIAQQRLPLTEDDEVAVCRRIIDAMFGIARLAELMRDDQVENIRVEGNRPVRVDYADGRCEELPPLVERAGDLVHLIREQAVQADRPFSYADPWVDIQLADGSRFHATGWVSKIPLFTIRRHRFLRVGLDDLIELGSLEQGLSAMLAAAVHTGMVIIATGAMNSGKTTLLRALCLEIDPEEIVVSVETDYELGLSASGHLRWVTELAITTRCGRRRPVDHVLRSHDAHRAHEREPRDRGRGARGRSRRPHRCGLGRSRRHVDRARAVSRERAATAGDADVATRTVDPVPFGAPHGLRGRRPRRALSQVA